MDLPPGAIFESPTPAALARTVAALARPVPAPAGRPTTYSPRTPCPRTPC
ncbi:hypothetical protein [Micromonospora sp. RTP1Z1]|nr:hypothetical protein [Micromonospora sp. RTP1Z1]